MPRNAPLSEREVAICHRLRDFRRATQIPRSAFALKVGVSAARLAEYENGRVPLRYEFFKSISAHFPLNPRWLVTGGGIPVLGHVFKDGKFREKIGERDLLSKVYDRVLKQHFDALSDRLLERWYGDGGLIAVLDTIQGEVADPAGRRDIPTGVLQDLFSEVETLLSAVAHALTERGELPVEPYFEPSE